MVNITHARIDKGLSMAQLADLVGVTPSAVSQWENGSKGVSKKNLEKLASVLDVSVEYLTGKKEKDRPISGRSTEELLAMFRQMSEEEHLRLIALLQASLADIRFQAHLRQEHQEEP